MTETAVTLYDRNEIIGFGQRQSLKLSEREPGIAPNWTSIALFKFAEREFNFGVQRLAGRGQENR